MIRTSRVILPALVASTLALTRAAHAQPSPPPSDAPEAPAVSEPVITPQAPPQDAPALAKAPDPPAAPAAPVVEKPALKLTPLGYVEAHYTYNFNRPSNGITNFRGFDNRHNTFTLANAALGMNAEYGQVSARVILQVGSTPSSYYLNEAAFAGSAVANGTGPELWKYLQEVNLSWKAPVGRGLLLQMGLFPSPLGPEVFAIKDNWNYSRSNLFFGLPYYHTGVRATYEWTDELSTTFSVFNGWNSVVDNNEEKSVQTNVTYKVPDKILVQALYFGGVERSLGARPEGPYWRHDFDLFAQYDATRWLSMIAHGNHGWEPNRVGTARWTAGAVYARVKPVERVYVALRGDRFHEQLATSADGRSSAPIFWGGARWVSSGTVTLDVRAHDNISLRLEYRHDAAERPLYYGRNVQGDGSAAAPFLANARTQNTLTFGATAWF